MISKQAWRRELRVRIRALSRASRQTASRRILKKLYDLPAYRRAGTVFFYAPKPDEVDTLPAIRHALRTGKRVFLPRLEKRMRKKPGRGVCVFYVMRWCEIQNLQGDLVRGPFGISEPRGKAVPLRQNFPDFVVCPGLAFDRRGTRLGRGGGYFDRFLGKLGRKTHVVGLAFSCQQVSRLPRFAHDIRIPKVITG